MDLILKEISGYSKPYDKLRVTDGTKEVSKDNSSKNKLVTGV